MLPSCRHDLRRERHVRLPRCPPPRAVNALATPRWWEGRASVLQRGQGRRGGFFRDMPRCEPGGAKIHRPAQPVRYEPLDTPSELSPRRARTYPSETDVRRGEEKNNRVGRNTAVPQLV